jgi:ribosomal protein L11 methylase PrmA
MTPATLAEVELPATVREGGSYRDPSGFVYRRDGVLYRQIAPSFADDWDAFEASGLRARLVEEAILVGHEEAPLELAATGPVHRVIRPEPIPFISYPYEWTFSQLKDAALLTLRAQALALERGMTLKDASAYNVQFLRGRPILIDSLSFERATPGAPWVAYRQFCEHFLAPLALMSRVDIRLGSLQRGYLDGIPLDLAARLLPGRTRFGLGLGAHIHLHARAQRRYADRPVGGGTSGEAEGRGSMSPARQAALVDSLAGTVRGLDWRPSGTEWAEYADNTSYDEAATRAKETLVARSLEALGGGVVWDLGANTGRYSRIAADLGRAVIAFDSDPAAAERHYRTLQAEGRTDTLPLVMDLVDPSPAVGWSGSERYSLVERRDADVLLALALVHHLAIGRNVPLPMLASFLAELAPGLIIEFVPKEDAMVRRLLASRRDVFPDYTIEGFRAAFDGSFELLDETPIEGTARTLFRYRRRERAAAGEGRGLSG